VDDLRSKSWEFLRQREDCGQRTLDVVPAGQKIELHVSNERAAASEFESNELHREKVVPAGQQVTVYVGPLRPGSYEFFDDFNPKTRGHLIVR
jgi:hypothetical protein